MEGHANGCLLAVPVELPGLHVGSQRNQAIAHAGTSRCHQAVLGSGCRQGRELHRLPGEVTGYLGPNGSGKSTTLKMITGLISPSQGEILFHGEPIDKDRIAYKQRLGYVPEEPQLYPHLTGAEYLEMVGQLRGIDEAEIARKTDGFLELLGLAGDRYVTISSYSKGMRQKVLLAAALLHNPDLILLDEPFSGLDVNSSLILRQLIQELASRGKVVLFSSHELETVERVCSRVVILHNGRV